MGMTVGGIPAEEVNTITTPHSRYEDVKDVREIVDRHVSYLAFEWDQAVIVGDKGRCKQTRTIRVRMQDVSSVEAVVGEPVPTTDPF